MAGFFMDGRSHRSKLSKAAHLISQLMLFCVLPKLMLFSALFCAFGCRTAFIVAAGLTTKWEAVIEELPKRRNPSRGSGKNLSKDFLKHSPNDPVTPGRSKHLPRVKENWKQAPPFRLLWTSHIGSRHDLVREFNSHGERRGPDDSSSCPAEAGSACQREFAG
jgi:hypothetical protein